MGAGLVAFLPLIAKGIGDTISLIGRSTSSPNYPSTPKLAKLPVQKATAQMEAYEAQRMQASIDAWKQKFPDLYKGGQYTVDDIAKQQQGMLGGNIAADMARSGLGPVHEGINQYRLSQDIGLSPITLSQRTSQAVTRQMAQNPEWTNKISGGTLATMIANNYQNQNAFSQFLGAQNTAMYTAGQAGSAYNTQALLAGLTGGARLGAQIYGQNQYGPLSPTGQGSYQAASMQQPPMQNPQQQIPTYGNTNYTGPGSSYGFPGNAPYNNPYGNAWMYQPNISPMAPPSAPGYGDYGNYYNFNFTGTVPYTGT